MKKRVKNQNEVDLHGMKHSEVGDFIENYVLMHQDELPLRIITGNSEKMKKIVREMLNEHEFNYQEGDFFNNGYITVLS